MSDGRTSALISSCRNLVGIAIFLYILPPFLGISGAWLAVPASDAAALVLAAWLLYSRQPHEHRTIAHRPVSESRPI